MATFPEYTAEYVDSRIKSKINERIDDIQSSIDEDIPVVIGIYWDDESSGHALFVIGNEKFDGKVTKLLCIDPSYDMQNQCYWNAYIDTEYRRGKYCCKYYAANRTPAYEGGDNVELRDYFCFYKKED